MTIVREALPEKARIPNHVSAGTCVRIPRRVMQRMSGISGTRWVVCGCLAICNLTDAVCKELGKLREHRTCQSKMTWAMSELTRGSRCCTQNTKSRGTRTIVVSTTVIPAIPITVPVIVSWTRFEKEGQEVPWEASKATCQEEMVGRRRDSWVRRRDCRAQKSGRVSRLSRVVTNISYSSPRPRRTVLTKSVLEIGSPMEACWSEIDLASWR